MDTTVFIEKLILGFLFISSPICLAYGTISGHAVFIVKGIIVINRAAEPRWYFAIMSLHLIFTLWFARWLYMVSCTGRQNRI